MKYDSQKHHRRSIRLKGYDYHNAGAYFVTLCTKNRKCVLDDPIVKGIINDVWLALPSWFPTIALDEFVIMPNHTHFVIWLGVGTSLADVQDEGKPRPYQIPKQKKLLPRLRWGMLSARSNHWCSRFIWIESKSMTLRGGQNSGSAIITNTSSATNAN